MLYELPRVLQNEQYSKNGGQENEITTKHLQKLKLINNKKADRYRLETTMNNETAAQLLQVLEKTISPGKNIHKPYTHKYWPSFKEPHNEIMNLNFSN